MSETLKQRVAWDELVDRLTAWVWDTMRFIDLCDADAAGYEDIHAHAERLTKRGYGLYGFDLDSGRNWSLADLQVRSVLLPPVPWRPIASFAREPHGRANRVLIVAGDVVGEAWYRDADGPDDTWGSGWWWAGCGPDEYYSSPVIETNDPPRLWMPLPVAPPIGEADGR